MVGRDHTPHVCFFCASLHSTWWRLLPGTRKGERQCYWDCSGNGINTEIATEIARKLCAWSGPHLPLPSHLLMHTYTASFPLQLQARLHASSHLLTSLICVKKGKFRRMAWGRKSVLAKDHSYHSSESPHGCLRCWSQNVPPQASGHTLLFCTGTTALPIPSRLVFIILDRISMCLVKKRLTMQPILSTQCA